MVVTIYTVVSILGLFVLPTASVISWFVRPKNPKSLIHIIRALITLDLIMIDLAVGSLLGAGLWTLILILVAVRANREVS